MWEDSHWISFICVAHSLQNVVKYAGEKQCMQKLLAKCRRLVGHFKHSALAIYSRVQIRVSDPVHRHSFVSVFLGYPRGCSYNFLVDIQPIKNNDKYSFCTTHTLFGTPPII